MLRLDPAVRGPEEAADQQDGYEKKSGHAEKDRLRHGRICALAGRFGKLSHGLASGYVRAP